MANLHDLALVLENEGGLHKELQNSLAKPHTTLFGLVRKYAKQTLTDYAAAQLVRHLAWKWVFVGDASVPLPAVYEDLWPDEAYDCRTLSNCPGGADLSAMQRLALSLQTNSVLKQAYAGVSLSSRERRVMLREHMPCSNIVERHRMAQHLHKVWGCSYRLYMPGMPDWLPADSIPPLFPSTTEKEVPIVAQSNVEKVVQHLLHPDATALTRSKLRGFTTWVDAREYVRKVGTDMAAPLALPERQHAVDQLRATLGLSGYLQGTRVFPESPAETQPETASETQPETQKEIIMNTTTIEITTKHFINGREVSTMTDAEIYDMIAKQEADIERLDAIKTKPARLAKQIAGMQAGVKALVDFLDAKDAKKD